MSVLPSGFIFYPLTKQSHLGINKELWSITDILWKMESEFPANWPTPNLRNLFALIQKTLFKSKMENTLQRSYFHVKYFLNFTNRIIISFWTLLSAL